MTDKTLTIKIHTDLGDAVAAQGQLEKAIKNTGAALQQVSTTAKNFFNGTAWETEYNHIVKVTGAINALKAAEANVKGVSGFNDSTIKSGSRAADLAAQFKQESNTVVKALQERFILEKTIREQSNGSMKVMQLKAAAEEKAIYEKLASDLQGIQNRIANGVIPEGATASKFRNSVIASADTALRNVLNNLTIEKAAIKEVTDYIKHIEDQAIINAQSFAKRMNSVPRISGQGSQIDMIGGLTSAGKQAAESDRAVFEAKITNIVNAAEISRQSSLKAIRNYAWQQEEAQYKEHLTRQQDMYNQLFNATKAPANNFANLSGGSNPTRQETTAEAQARAQKQVELAEAKNNRLLSLLNNFNTATERIETEAAARREARERAAADRSVAIAQLRGERLSRFKSTVVDSTASLSRQLELEQSIRINGINSIQTILIQAAHAEEAVQKEKASKLQAIEKGIEDKSIATLKQANAARIAIEQDAANKITAIRRSTEAVQARTTARNTTADTYRRETQQIQQELDRRIAIDVSTRVNGINHIHTIELQAAADEVAIRRNAANQINAIEAGLRNGSIANITAANARTAAINQHTQAQIVANRETLAAAQATARLNAEQEANARNHTSFIGRAAEFIGVYRVLNGVINTVSNSIRAIPKIGIERESTLASLSATVGTGGMDSAFTALTTEARRTGIELNTVRENFRTFQASASLAGESLQDIWHMFTNLNTVSTALHLSTDKVQLTFLAISQIFNKTKVQSEELVKQLGNLLPGAFASFVQANKLAGESTQEASLRIVKAMKAGTVAAHETIKNFTDFYAQRFAGAFELARTGLNANLNNMKTSFQLLGEAIYNSTSGPIMFFVKGLTAVTDGVTKLFTATGELKSQIDSGISISIGVGAASLLTFAANTAIAQKALVGLVAVGQQVGLTLALMRGSVASFGIAATATSAAVGLLESALAFLASPFILIAGITALGYSIYSMGKEASNTSESIHKMRKTFDELNALKAAKTSGDTELQLKLEVEQNQKVVDAKEQIRFTEERLAKMRANNAHALLGVTKDEIKLVDDLTVAQKNLNDARLFAKDEIGMRKLAEEENAKNFKNLQLGNSEADTTKGANVVTAISRAMIKSIESEAKAALERLQTQQEGIDNRVRLRQLSFNDAYKERLRLSKEILAIELTKADKEIAAIQGRAPLREASQGTKTATPQFEGALKQYTNAITTAADKWKVPAEYIHAVMSKENASGKLDAIGKNIRNGQVVSRDLGLMQINDKAHPEFESKKLLTDASYNINAGTKILAASLKAFPGDLVKGFAAYNAGIGGAAKGVSKEYGLDVSKRVGKSLKQVSQGMTDIADVSAQLDAKDRAYEADKQRTQEAEKQLALHKEELTIMGNVIEVDFLRAKGLREQADILELNNKYRIQEELLGINGLEVEKAKVLHIKNAEALQLGLSRVTERRNVAEQAYKDKVHETNTLLNVGVLSQREAATLLNDSKKAYLSLQDAEIKKLQEILALNGSNLQAQDAMNNIKRSKQGEIAQGIGGLNSTIQSGLSGEFGFVQRAQADDANNQINKSLAADSNKFLYDNGLKTHEEFLKAKAVIDEKYATATSITQMKLYSGIADVTATSLQSLSEVMADMYGKNSKQAQAAFIAHKAMAVIQAGINVAQGVTAAMAQGGIAGIATGALVAASGAVQVAKIVSAPMPQAHAGLTNVPEDQTYLLKKNERVLAPQQNKDLTNALQNGTMGGKQAVNNKIINIFDPSIVGDYLSTTEGENMIVNIMNKNQAA